ncbi:hypothetical protein L596_029631 [Steinernema carpocapsae]|uniref:Uncharacterized protein n=1 Tax=Steinernema carpocapsae TaxID=34508 RepID=A0A4U5LV82_STECR|nr:hypothetical protein L596_029631 [Steinernema carpocapsae]
MQFYFTDRWESRRKVDNGEYLMQAYKADWIGLQKFNRILQKETGEDTRLYYLNKELGDLCRYQKRIAGSLDLEYMFNLALERWKEAPSKTNKLRVVEAPTSQRIQALQKILIDYLSKPKDGFTERIEKEMSELDQKPKTQLGEPKV